jgi:hypothetical protein
LFHPILLQLPTYDAYVKSVDVCTTEKLLNCLKEGSSMLNSHNGGNEAVLFLMISSKWWHRPAKKDMRATSSAQFWGHVVDSRSILDLWRVGRRRPTDSTNAVPKKGGFCGSVRLLVLGLQRPNVVVGVQASQAAGVFEYIFLQALRTWAEKFDRSSGRSVQSNFLAPSLRY